MWCSGGRAEGEGGTGDGGRRTGEGFESADGKSGEATFRGRARSRAANKYYKQRVSKQPETMQSSVLIALLTSSELRREKSR